MSNWVSNLFTSLLDPASLRRNTEERQTPEPNIPGDNDGADDDDTSDRFSVEPSINVSESASAENTEFANDEEDWDDDTPAPLALATAHVPTQVRFSDQYILALFRERLPSERLLIELLKLMSRQIRVSQNPSSDEFESLWLDVLSNVPPTGSFSTPEQHCWPVDKKYMEAGGTPETAVYTTAGGVVIPRLSSRSTDHVRIKIEDTGDERVPIQREDTREPTPPRHPNGPAMAPTQRDDTHRPNHHRPLQRYNAFVERPRHLNNPVPVDATPPSGGNRVLIPSDRHPPWGHPHDFHQALTSRDNSPSTEPPHPSNDGEEVPVVKTESDSQALPRERIFLDQLAPTAEYKPRQFAGAYEANTLPSKPQPRMTRLRAQLEQPRGEDEEFSLQMILPPAHQTTAGSHLLPLAAVFVPADANLDCAMLKTQESSVIPKHILATRVPQDEMSASLAALGKDFDARACPPHREPLTVDVRDEMELHSTERNPDNIDDVFRAELHLLADYGGTAHNNSRRRMLDAVEDAVKEVDSTELLMAGTPFSLNAVVTPDVLSNQAGVIFIPDDPSISPRGTDLAGLIHDSETSSLVIREYPRKNLGEFETMGRYKRKRMAEQGADEGESVLKRVCGLEGARYYYAPHAAGYEGG
ncbi:hypothetical protein B0H14DRAFT_3124394 [Mycena olivaceomarginata]|nr:hypothetical protein B0H14DRAFT_3124394 [Mycena olivaceomarginata]